MPSPASSVFTLTSEEGDFVVISPFYEQIIERANRATALVNPQAWTNIEIVNVKGNHSWVLNTTTPRQEKDFIGFGEILGHQQGTRTSAKGNTYPPDKKLRDGDSVKFTFAIGQPQDAPARFQTIFNDQLSVIDREFRDSCSVYVQHAETTRDADSVPTPEAEYKHFLRSSTLDPSSANDAILLTTNNIYVANTIPRRSLAPGARTLPSRLTNQATTNSNPSTGSTAAAPSIVSLDTTYDPNTTFPDHQGEQFEKHQNSRVAQLDFRDEHGMLVPMADVPRIFRPGAFIQFRVTLHSYDILDKKGPEPRRNRSHVLRLHSAQILRESDQEYEPIRVTPPAPSFSPVKRSNNDFDSNSSPSKRNRSDRGARSTDSSSMTY